MGIMENIANFDKKFAWSFSGFLLAVIFGLLSIYTEFWKETKPKLEFEIISNTPVISVREKIDDLEVIYQSQDIAKNGRTLSVVLVRAINNGSLPIRQADYDNRFPVGLKIKSGTLIRADISGASNAYLSNAVEISRAGSKFSFSPAILEAGEWFSTKILVLHEAGKKPEISSFGKVAGMHESPKVKPILVTQEQGIFQKAFYGDAWVQALRTLIYFIVATLLIITAIFLSEAIGNKIKARRRNKLVQKFKRLKKVTLSQSDDFIFENYLERGSQYVQRLVNLAINTGALQDEVSRYKQRFPENFNEIHGVPDYEMGDNMMEFLEFRNGRHYLLYDPPLMLLRDMIRNKFIEQNANGVWIAVPERLKVAKAFIDYIDYVGATGH